MKSIHQTVLLKETIEGLSLGAKSVVLDATFGGGGHSLSVCENVPDTKIIALDQDGNALDAQRDKFTKCDITFVKENFRNLDKVLKGEGIEHIDGIIFDLGLSSDQLEHSGRGFSFLQDEPLIMTMKEDPSPEDLTAGDVVNMWSEEALADIIYGYGEERFARRIARAIVHARGQGSLKTTKELAEVVKGAVPARYQKGRLHPGTKTFQAIRITVNDELNALKEGLAKGFDVLNKDGRMAVISFHSLEDRVVKRFYKQKVLEKKAKLVNKKVIIPGEKEIKQNPRSRSAKLRVIQKIK